jgi:hypothetical protein
MNPECHLEDDGGGTEAVAIEAVQSDGHRQSLWVRVGPVYYGGEQAAEPGVWITYQENHMHTPLAGPVLLTPAVWRELSAAVEERLARHEKGC